MSSLFSCQKELPSSVCSNSGTCQARPFIKLLPVGSLLLRCSIRESVFLIISLGCLKTLPFILCSTNGLRFLSIGVTLKVSLTLPLPNCSILSILSKAINLAAILPSSFLFVSQLYLKPRNPNSSQFCAGKPRYASLGSQRNQSTLVRLTYGYKCTKSVYIKIYFT